MFLRLFSVQRGALRGIGYNSGRFFSKAAKESKKITKKTVGIYSMTAATLGLCGFLYFYSSNDDFKLRMNRDYISKWPWLYRRLSRSFPDVPLPPLNRDIYNGSKLHTLFCEWFCTHDFINPKGLKRQDIIEFVKTLVPITEEDAQELYSAQDLESVLNDYRMPKHQVYEGSTKSVSIDEALYFFTRVLKKYNKSEEEVIEQLKQILEEEKSPLQESYRNPQYIRSYNYIFEEFYKKHHTSKEEIREIINRRIEYQKLQLEYKEIEENYYNAKYELERLSLDEKEMYKLSKEEYTEEDVQYYKQEKKIIKNEMNEYSKQMKHKRYELDHFKF